MNGNTSVVLPLPFWALHLRIAGWHNNLAGLVQSNAHNHVIDCGGWYAANIAELFVVSPPQ